MRDQIVKGREFNILSRSIDNATVCTVINVFEDCFEVQLHRSCKYEPEESVELFAMTSKGQLYFETIVKDVNNDILQIWYPITYKYLQRREYSRISVNKEVSLKDTQGDIVAKIIDISAGGIKLSTNCQLNLMQSYEININIDSDKVVCEFEPIRIEYINDKFVSSGRFSSITNYDRIKLFQYCCGKQIESSNK